jgi:multisubunit Na+/H+ antiporter MnhB subunit
MADMLTAILVVAWATGGLALFATMVLLVVIAFSTKPEKRKGFFFRYNPINAILVSEMLTERGLRVRRYILVALGIAVLNFATVLAVISVAERWRG